VQLVKNGTAHGSSYQVAKTAAGSQVVTFGTPLTFVSGDTINAEITGTSGTLSISVVQIFGLFN